LQPRDVPVPQNSHQKCRQICSTVQPLSLHIRPELRPACRSLAGLHPPKSIQHLGLTFLSRNLCDMAKERDIFSQKAKNNVFSNPAHQFLEGLLKFYQTALKYYEFYSTYETIQEFNETFVVQKVCRNVRPKCIFHW
jgi:hypothetical protein